MSFSVEVSPEVTNIISIDTSFADTIETVIEEPITDTKTLERFILITSLSRCSNREITAEPIFPAPKTATVYELFFIISKDKCYFESNNN